jgi:hypothetical protein
MAICGAALMQSESVASAMPATSRQSYQLPFADHTRAKQHRMVFHANPSQVQAEFMTRRDSFAVFGNFILSLITIPTTAAINRDTHCCGSPRRSVGGSQAKMTVSLRMCNHPSRLTTGRSFAGPTWYLAGKTMGASALRLKHCERGKGELRLGFGWQSAIRDGHLCNLSL